MYCDRSSVDLTFDGSEEEETARDEDLLVDLSDSLNFDLKHPRLLLNRGIDYAESRCWWTNQWIDGLVA